MATQTTNPRRAGRTAATKAAAKPASVEETVDVGEVETDQAELEKTVYVLDNRGRTKGGEGKLVHWNLHEKYVRGNVFADPDVVEVRVLVVRNPNAAV